MLWALLTIYVFGGKDIINGFFLVDVKKEIHASVTDSERAEKILEIRKALKAELKEAYRFYNQKYDQIEALNRLYETKADEFSEIKNAISERRRRVQKILLDKRMEMRDLMTREEWAQVFPESKE